MGYLIRKSPMTTIIVVVLVVTMNAFAFAASGPGDRDCVHIPAAMAIPPRFSLMEMSLSPGEKTTTSHGLL